MKVDAKQAENMASKTIIDLFPIQETGMVINLAKADTGRYAVEVYGRKDEAGCPSFSEDCGKDELFAQLRYEHLIKNTYENHDITPALPHICWVRRPGGVGTAAVRRGFRGFFAVGKDVDIDILNRTSGITKAQKAAMMHGAEHGWDAPEASPCFYNVNGVPILKA